MRLPVALAASLFAFPWAAPPVEFKETPPDLSQVKRIYIDQLGGGKTSDQMRDMIITALQNSKLFVITENPERADAFLRGSADDKIYEEEHSSSDSIGLHANAGSSDGTHNYSSGTSSSSSHGLGITDSESSHSKERRHETSASIRLVNADGDVLWSTTQESSGGKFRGAMADVADRIARQLVEDTKKARAAH
jgi:predicted Zn-dependent protease